MMSGLYLISGRFSAVASHQDGGSDAHRSYEYVACAAYPPWSMYPPWKRDEEDGDDDGGVKREDMG